MIDDPLEYAARIADSLETLGIRYLIGGSLASSLVGEPRSTNDVDFVVDLTSSRVDALVRLLSIDYHVDEATARAAARDHTSFSAVHRSGRIKADFFVLEEDRFSRGMMDRRRRVRVERDVDLFFYSAEDILLQKLRWFDLGGGLSERQWRDVLGIIKVQKETLDLDYLRKGAALLNVTSLLERALGESNDK